MERMIKHVFIVYCFVMLFCSELTVSLGISPAELKRLQSQISETEADADNDKFPDSLLPPMLQKRACNGFPCMYSHLGTKAGRASLYKTLAGFIDNCFTDPACDPGRRKRFSSMESIQRLLKTPIREYNERQGS